MTADSVERLARARASRLHDRTASPQPKEPSLNAAKPIPETPSAVRKLEEPARVFVQGDPNRLAEFAEALRSELRAQGTTVRVVQTGEAYDYNVAFVLNGTSAAALALDTGGVLVTASIDSGFTVKGVTEGVAKKLAKQLTSLKR